MLGEIWGYKIKADIRKKSRFYKEASGAGNKITKSAHPGKGENSHNKTFFYEPPLSFNRQQR
jgi:hypothetical protein